MHALDLSPVANAALSHHSRHSGLLHAPRVQAHAQLLQLKTSCFHGERCKANTFRVRHLLQIAAAFAKAKEVANGQKLPPVESIATGILTVPDEYLQEVSKQMEQYRDDQKTVKSLQRLQALTSKTQHQLHARGGRSMPNDRSQTTSCEDASLTLSITDLDDIDQASMTNTQVAIGRWQQKATYCLKQLGIWAGSSIALQQPLQEYLLHILVNDDVHTDRLLSVQAYKLLQLNLQAHPPSAVQGGLSSPQPAVLLLNDSCWQPMANTTSAALTEAVGDKSKFALFQDLIRNAADIVSGSGRGDSSADGSSSSAASSVCTGQGSQGKALLLLYLVQVLQADCCVRLSVFRQHMAAASGAVLSQQDQQRARERAAVLIQHSFLFRLMEVSCCL